MSEQLGLVSSIDKARLDYLSNSYIPVEINASSFTIDQILSAGKNIISSDEFNAMLNIENPQFKYFSIKFKNKEQPILFLISTYTRTNSGAAFNTYYVLCNYNNKLISGNIIISPSNVDPVISIILTNNTDYLNGYASDKFVHGQQCAYGLTKAIHGSWVRFMEFSSNGFLSCNVTFTRTWNSSGNTAISFTINRGMGNDGNGTQCAVPFIQQTGQAGEIYKVRVLYYRSGPSYLEIFLPAMSADATLPNYYLLQCDNSDNPSNKINTVTLLSSPTKTTSIPAGYAVREYKFFRNDTLSLNYGEDFTFTSSNTEWNIQVCPTTVITNVDNDSLGVAKSIINLNPPYNGWQVGQVYKVYIQRNTVDADGIVYHINNVDNIPTIHTFHKLYYSTGLTEFTIISKSSDSVIISVTDTTTVSNS